MSEDGPIELWPQSKVSDMKTVADKIVHDADTATQTYFEAEAC